MSKGLIPVFWIEYDVMLWPASYDHGKHNCARRLEAARDRLIRSQEHLRSLLKEKDDRKKVLIDTIAKQKVGVSDI